MALVADIEKAFLMISVDPNDHDVLCFLWVEDPFDNDVKLVTMRFTRVVFGFLALPTKCHHKAPLGSISIFQTKYCGVLEPLNICR